MLDYEVIINLLTERIKGLEASIFVKEYTIKELNKKVADLEQSKEQ